MLFSAEEASVALVSTNGTKVICLKGEEVAFQLLPGEKIYLRLASEDEINELVADRDATEFKFMELEKKMISPDIFKEFKEKQAKKGEKG